MGRRSDHSREELREMALQAAEIIVAEQGMSGLTMRKVATAIGYTVGSLYLAFRNQDDMILYLNARTVDEMYEALVAAARRRRKPETRIRAMARCYIEYAHRNRNRWRMAFEHSLPDGRSMPDWLTLRIERMNALVVDTVQEIMPDARDTEVTVAATALWSGIHGICILALTGKLDVMGASSVKQLSDFLVDHVIAGIVGEW